MTRPYCQKCTKPCNSCICAFISTIKNAWPIHILQHPNEEKHAIGTAKIAQLCLSNCITHSVKNQAKIDAALTSIIGLHPLLIFPSNNSTSVDSLAANEPRPLIFIDATWRKAKRMLHESALLASLPKLILQPTTPSNYRIRKSPNADALSTVEAIADTLSILEKDHEKYLPLRTGMNQMIEQQINLMGNSVYEKNYKK